MESLKHSTDLERSLQRLLRSLKSGGTLAIVEDLFFGDECLPAARELKRHWMLARLYREPDYLAALGYPCTVIDLSDRVLKISPVRAALRLAALKLCVSLRHSHRLALRAFVGGVQLDRLYACGAMRYKAIFCTREEAA